MIIKKLQLFAVDPTSPFTGGAILGDRIRMSDLNLDEGVYIRSMGTRGSLGGLSAATSAVIKFLMPVISNILLSKQWEWANPK